jgi:integrase
MLTDWLKKGPPIMTEEDAYLENLRKEWEEQFPEAMAAIREFDRKVMAELEGRRQQPQRNRKKGYNLIKVKNKKHGFIYYVRYTDNGKLLPSKWSTGTNALEEAERFAVQFREELLAGYYAKRAKKQPQSQPQPQVLPQAPAAVKPESAPAPTQAKPAPLESIELYAALEASYKDNSAYLISAQNRGKTLDKKTRSVYDHFMNKRFIPFLQEQNITASPEITPSIIFKFQDYLLASGIMAGTINLYLGSVKAVFDYLFMNGSISDNVFDRARMLKTGGRKAKTVRGCLEVDKLKDVFIKDWEPRLQYMLCLMIYSTGMRDSELERMRVQDIVQIDDCYFVDVVKSKTGNGVRKVPLHPFVYKNLMEFTKGLHPESYIFSARGNHNQSTLYKEAAISLGKQIAMTEEQLEEQKISFYSGRHYWKTLMNAENLGDDIEEYFMGRKVSGDVKKRYNHKDKQGKKKLLEKAQQVFAILGEKLFKGKTDGKAESKTL